MHITSRYPYDHNPKSQIGMPTSIGRFYVHITEGKGAPYYALRSNSWYLQSAFWGGKTKFVVPMLKDLKMRTRIDRDNGVYSMVIQDERYFNYYMWKHGNRSDIDMRILGPSYLFPYNPQGFGEHITKNSRPIIIHGTAKPGKMVKGEAELKVEPVGELDGKKGQCFDVAVLKDQIGTYV